MEIKIGKKEFLDGLSWTQSVVDRKATMPILANCCLTAKNKTLTITATDLEIGVLAEYAANVINEGSVTVSARSLFDIIKELPDAPVSIKVQKNNWVLITSGKSEFRIVGLSAEEFPSLPAEAEGEVNSIESADFLEMINKTAYAMSTDETRYNLNGVYLEATKENNGTRLRMVATDGHRLSCIDRPVKGKFDLESGVIVPRKGIMQWKKLLESNKGEFSLKIDRKHVTVHRDNVTLIIRLIDGQFPPYKQVIPKEHPLHLSLSRDDFCLALRRVMLVTTDRSRGVRFTVSPGNLVLTAKNPDVGEAHEELGVEYSGSVFEVGFNVRYFLDIIGVLEDEKMVIAMKGDVGPCLIRSEVDPSFQAVVMPMRL